MKKLPQQIIPLVILLVLAVGALITARILLIPETFGKYGHYRADVMDEISSQELIYAGDRACYDCHDDISELKATSYHNGVSCEVCHGPAAGHVEEPDEVTPNIPRERDKCTRCHGYNPSRPSGFPQIIPMMHNPGRRCMSCHNPHNPELPHAPEECSACHREISSKKAVSHHATLVCTQCHTASPEHLINPRVARAGKPTSEKTCGQCHAESADSPRTIPRIDIESHGGRYLCWECHYPHYPEAK